MLRQGISKYRPLKPGYGVIASMLAACSAPSAHIASSPAGRCRSRASPAPWRTRRSPTPRARWTGDRAWRCARRRAPGGCSCGGIRAMPWPRRIRFVRCEQAARNTSGAEECEYSSRKWCSTSQTYSMPSRSASSTWSSASSSRRSAPRVPRPRHLMLVEQAELHRRSSPFGLKCPCVCV